MTAVPDDFAELVVQGADRVGGVDYSAQHWAETPGTGRTGSRRPRTPDRGMGFLCPSSVVAKSSNAALGASALTAWLTLINTAATAL